MLPYYIESPQAHWDSSQSRYPSHTYTHGNPHTHARQPCCLMSFLIVQLFYLVLLSNMYM